jgi:hypothetical protein
LRRFARMKWSDDQSAVAFCDGDLHLGSGSESHARFLNQL